MRIELTIKCDYLPSWYAYEGVRELLQNGKDAETEFDAPLTVKFRKDTNTLVIENDGTVLPHEALLLGHTSKVGRPDLIGKFGEGLKLGLLALVRAGHSVKIRSGSEVWVPSIQRSEKFNADVLTFDIQKGREPKNRVVVEIGGITEEAWLTMRNCFLFLVPLKDTECVKTPRGSLLIGPQFAGRVYVKGIFVSIDPHYQYGYDLIDADLDRDRKMVNRYDLQYRTQAIWSDALARRPDLLDSFGKLLETEASDVDGIDAWAAGNLSSDVQQGLADSFIKRHGDQALPVATLGDSQDVEHLGKKGVVVPKSLLAVLQQKLGTVDQNKAKLREESTQVYGWHDLSIDERASIERAIEMTNGVEPVTINDIAVVDFRDPKILGMFKSPSGRVLLAKKILQDPHQTLRVLVHEVAHRQGNDGQHDHVSRIEHIWSNIVARLCGEAN